MPWSGTPGCVTSRCETPQRGCGDWNRLRLEGVRSGVGVARGVPPRVLVVWCPGWPVVVAGPDPAAPAVVGAGAAVWAGLAPPPPAARPPPPPLPPAPPPP